MIRLLLHLLAVQCINQTYLGIPTISEIPYLFVCLFFFAVCEAVFQIYDSSLLIWLLVDALQFSVNLAEVNLHILRKAVSVVIHSSAISVVKYINRSISVVRYTAGSSLCVEISFS